MTPAPLPIDEALPRIADVVAQARAAVVVAPPGAGKTTRVPPALLDRGPLLLLQPRRVAARAIARRIAEEQGLALGEDVGWQVRLEKRFTEKTRLLVATEGILTARLVSDPLLSGFATVVIDEFHERSLHADLGLALARQAARARSDLALVVMSATLDPGPVAEFLGGCPIVEVAARAHPVVVAHAPGRSPAAAVREALAREGGHVLCFLPGAAEIGKVRQELGALDPVRVLPLHGRLEAAEQDEALAPSRARKVILATNVAETSLTVDGVTEVIDTGLHKIVRYDAERGFDRLELERITQDSADQRSGRAGRTGPGRATRLWDARERLRPRRDAEITRVDLASPVLEVLGWGEDPAAFEWFERPSAAGLEAAMDLLRRLGAVEGRRLTALGEALRHLPLPPRLGRVLVAAGGSRRAAALCAVLAEPQALRRSSPPAATDSDVLSGADELERSGGYAARVARDLEAAAGRLALPGPGVSDDTSLRQALFLGYADRVARRRAPGSPRLLLASGAGAILARESGVVSGEFLVAHELGASPGSGKEAIVRTATRIEADWLVPDEQRVVHRLENDETRAVEQLFYGQILLAERPTAVDPETAERLLQEELTRRGPGPEGEALVRRLRVAGLEVDLAARMAAGLGGRTRLPDLELVSLLQPEERRQLDRLAPLDLEMPSGRRRPLEYREDGTVALAVKLQELFGLAQGPTVGARPEPVLLLLLAPNGRPVQTTRDLQSFWSRTYPEVRKELRGRYPKHAWPEDPGGVRS